MIPTLDTLSDATQSSGVPGSPRGLGFPAMPSRQAPRGVPPGSAGEKRRVQSGVSHREFGAFPSNASGRLEQVLRVPNLASLLAAGGDGVAAGGALPPSNRRRSFKKRCVVGNALLDEFEETAQEMRSQNLNRTGMFSHPGPPGAERHGSVISRSSGGSPLHHRAHPPGKSVQAMLRFRNALTTMQGIGGSFSARRDDDLDPTADNAKSSFRHPPRNPSRAGSAFLLDRFRQMASGVSGGGRAEEASEDNNTLARCDIGENAQSFFRHPQQQQQQQQPPRNPSRAGSAFLLDRFRQMANSVSGRGEEAGDDNTLARCDIGENAQSFFRHPQQQPPQNPSRAGSAFLLDRFRQMATSVVSARSEDPNDDCLARCDTAATPDFFEVVRQAPLGETFLTAAEAGDVPGMATAFGSMTMEGVDEIRDVDTGQTGWHCGARGGHTNVLRWMADNGGDTDIEDADGCTAAHFAAAGGHLEVMQWLYSAGHDISHKDNHKLTPEDYASINQQHAVLKWLHATGMEALLLHPDDAVLYSPDTIHGSSLSQALLSLFLGESEIFTEDVLPWRLPPSSRCLFTSYSGAVKVAGGVLVLGGAFQLECHPFNKEGYVERLVATRKVLRSSDSEEMERGEEDGGESGVSPALSVSRGSVGVRGSVGASSTRMQSSSGFGGFHSGGEMEPSPSSSDSTRSEDLQVYHILCTTLHDQAGTLVLQVFRFASTGACYLRLVPLAPAASSGHRKVAVSGDGKRRIRPMSAAFAFVTDRKVAPPPPPPPPPAHSPLALPVPVGGGGGGGAASPADPPELDPQLFVLERPLTSGAYRHYRPLSAVKRPVEARERIVCSGKAALVTVFAAIPTAELSCSVGLVTTYLRFIKRGAMCRAVFFEFKKRVVRLQCLARCIAARKRRAVLQLRKQWEEWRTEASANIAQKLRIANTLKNSSLMHECHSEADSVGQATASMQQSVESLLKQRRTALRHAHRSGIPLPKYTFLIDLEELIPSPAASYKASQELLQLMEEDDNSDGDSLGSGWSATSHTLEVSFHGGDSTSAGLQLHHGLCEIAVESTSGPLADAEGGHMLGLAIVGDWQATEESAFTGVDLYSSSDSDPATPHSSSRRSRRSWRRSSRSGTGQSPAAESLKGARQPSQSLLDGSVRGAPPQRRLKSLSRSQKKLKVFQGGGHRRLSASQTGR